jgi:hypothetical protein
VIFVAMAKGCPARDTAAGSTAMAAINPQPLSTAQPAIVAYAPIGPVRDAEHLKLLKVFHYVYGGLVLAGASLFIGYIVLGVVMLRNPKFMQFPAPSNPAGTTMPSVQPAATGFAWMMIAIGVTFVTAGWTIGILSILSGRAMAKRRRRTFSLVIAGINCLVMPLGTALGVFTFIVLLRESIAELYGEGPSHNRAVGAR